MRPRSYKRSLLTLFVLFSVGYLGMITLSMHRMSDPSYGVGRDPQAAEVDVSNEEDTHKRRCRHTVENGQRVTDDAGRTCLWNEILSNSSCCPSIAERFTCGGCGENDCCNSYEVCVSCCMDSSNNNVYRGRQKFCFSDALPRLPS
ncbi:hypothetical protein PROFUN_00322 [Planoprotostelium fungivorum]|uniref:SREBP regulating gene protein n=1 Tax=Planoprotostelium fungivorum TaxID=1890364 RepID=A0A2P6NY17_9EUKA|nr:hypothetical protein PROFUN_00322 [Planoprotostelium fungivorum]